MKNMANRIAALEGRKSAAAPLFPIFIMAAGVPDHRVAGLTGAGLAIDRRTDETVRALEERALERLGDKPTLPLILSYKYADTQGETP